MNAFDEAVGAGAKAIDVNVHEYRVDAPEWLPYCICGWRSGEKYDVVAFDRHIVGLALTAALPHLLAPIRELADLMNDDQDSAALAQLLDELEGGGAVSDPRVERARDVLRYRALGAPEQVIADLLAAYDELAAKVEMVRTMVRDIGIG